MNKNGIHIALIGIDGIGKTTLCQELANHLSENNDKVKTISWRNVIEQDNNKWPNEPLQELWLETYRCLFGGASWNKKNIEIPRNFPEWHKEKTEDLIQSAGAVESNKISGVIAASMVEMAGNVLLSSDIIQPLLSDGYIVIQETYPYKHVLKEILIAEKMAENEDSKIYSDVFKTLHFTLESLFSNKPMAPDIGVFLDGSARMAYKWRMLQSGKVGVIEDFGAAGGTGVESYINLQEMTAKFYRKLAEKNNWIVHNVEDVDKEKNIKKGLDKILSSPEFSSEKYKI